MDSLTELLTDELKDLFNAENQLSKALPKMAKKASSAALKKGFTAHLEDTKQHIERLTKVGELLDISLKGKTCKAMKGLIEEGADVLEEDGEDAVIDCALIGSARRVEHYEIAAYATVIGIATQLGHKDVVKLLEKNLADETATDEKLATLVKTEVLPAAAEAGEMEEAA